MSHDIIKIKMNGGYLVADRNPDPDYDGIYVTFEDDDGVQTDVVIVECKKENDKKKIDVYCYEDVHSDDFTRKYTLDSEEIRNAFMEE